MKVVFYVKKEKPYLYQHFSKEFVILNTYDKECVWNGKISAECDFGVEEIRKGWGCLNGTRYFRSSEKHYYPDYELEQQSRLCFDEINEYLKGTLNEKAGYVINTKNLNVFDKPRELGDYYSQGQVDFIEETELWRLNDGITTLKNMRYGYRYSYSKHKLEKYILIPISSQEACNILNHKQDTLIRRNVLKEMK